MVIGSVFTWHGEFVLRTGCDQVEISTEKTKAASNAVDGRNVTDRAGIVASQACNGKMAGV